MAVQLISNKSLIAKTDRKISPVVQKQEMEDGTTVVHNHVVYQQPNHMDIYGESELKYYNVGFRVNCLVQYNRPETITNDAGADLNANIQLRFQRANLASEV